MCCIAVTHFGLMPPDEPIIHPTLPYLHIIHPLPDHFAIPYPLSKEQESYLVDELAPPLMKSFDMLFEAVRRGDGNKDGGWNLLLTLSAHPYEEVPCKLTDSEHLHLIPRSAPNFPLPGGHEPLELNSLGYAGMMLTRSQEEEQILLSTVETQGGLMKVLEHAGVPRQWGELALNAQAAQRELNAL